MTQTIKQLTTRIAELEEENARLRTVPMKYRRMQFNAQLQDENNELRSQLAAAQEENEQLRSVVFAAESLDKAELGFQVKQLTDQLANAEQRVAELIGELEHTREQKNLLWFEFSIATQKLAAEQLNNKRLRDALEFFFPDWKTYDHLSWKYKAKEALSTPISTEALDAYVAEKVKEAIK